jgi:hypothetical protein
MSSKHHPIAIVECLVLLAALALTACEAERARPSADAAGSDGVAAPTSDGALRPDVTALPDLPPRAGCRPATAGLAAPTSIDEVVKLVNGLARPVSLACFLESLARPLRVTATSSILSLQPAVGSRSPRIFLLTSRLVMSVVFDGRGRDVVELGEFVTPTHTIKAELGFPIKAEVPPAEPYEHVNDANVANPMKPGSRCRFCHTDEEAAPRATGAIAFTSVALKPARGTRVPLSSLLQERSTCDAAAEPARCELLRAFFDHGEVSEAAFPEVVRTFFD